MIEHGALAELTSTKGWVKVGYDRTIWIPIPPAFRPDFTKDEWAGGFAQTWWDASGRKHSKREVKGFKEMLFRIQETIFSEQPCHRALLHMPDVGYPPLVVCFGIWKAIADTQTQLRELVHADEPVAIDQPVVEDVYTDNLGHGLKSLYHQLLTESQGVLAVLNYAWRSEEYETALHIYTACSDWGRLHGAMDDIDEMTKTITIVSSTVQA